MPDELLNAVRNLTLAVERLEKKLEEYPKRTEVERRFATQRQLGQRRRRWFFGILAGLLVSTLLGFFATVTTVSVCFISADARANKAPVACNILPGYSDAIAENKQIMKQFEGLLKQPEINNRRLDRIEKRLGIK